MNHNTTSGPTHPVPARDRREAGLTVVMRDPKFRNDFAADHIRTRISLQIRALREQRGWSQAELGRRMGKPQSVVARFENPDCSLTLTTLFEIAAAFDLPLFIDMPQWDDWLRLTADMSSANLERDSYVPPASPARTEEG